MDWKRGPMIGRGSCAAVYIAATPTGDLFAVKSADLSSSTSLQREHCFLSQLSSPFVVKSLGSGTTVERSKPVYNLFLEYAPGGALSDQILKAGGSLNEGVIRSYVYRILQGLDYLHRKGLVHCDIKGQNILVGGDGGLKIADFGCAKWGENGGDSQSAVAGTPAYMAPEVARGEEQSFPADIWALGCTVIEMATGFHPWPEMKDPASALFRIANSDDVPAFPSWFSENARDFLSKCLTRDSRRRWTALELLQHVFFAGNCGEMDELTKRSPTSVMDQGFWDSLEAVDSARNATNVSDSSANRIRDLITDNLSSSSNSNSQDWTEEDGWMTVRNQEIQECWNSHIEDSECVGISGVLDEEIENSNSNSNSNDVISSLIDDVSKNNLVMCSDSCNVDCSIILMEIFFIWLGLFNIFSIPFPHLMVWFQNQHDNSSQRFISMIQSLSLVTKVSYSLRRDRESDFCS